MEHSWLILVICIDNTQYKNYLHGYTEESVKALTDELMSNLTSDNNGFVSLSTHPDSAEVKYIRIDRVVGVQVCKLEN